MSGENLFAEMIASEEERKEQQKIAQVKQQGYNYFTLIYKGRLPVSAIKLQGLLNIEPYKTTTAEGDEVWSGREGADAYYFHEDSLGRKTARIWDDPDKYNRFWISRHVGYPRAEFELEDKELAKEISELSEMPFKAELSEEELLVKKKRDIEKRLSELQSKKKDEASLEQAQSQIMEKRRGRRKDQPEQPQAENGVAQGA